MRMRQDTRPMYKHNGRPTCETFQMTCQLTLKHKTLVVDDGGGGGVVRLHKPKPARSSWTDLFAPNSYLKQFGGRNDLLYENRAYTYFGFPIRYPQLFERIRGRFR